MLNLVFLMAPQGSPGGGSSILGFLPFILIIVIMYFLMIRPQAKRQKERQKLLENLQKGDKVVTTGGIQGKIVGFADNEQTIILQVDDKLKLNVERSAVNHLQGQKKE